MSFSEAVSGMPGVVLERGQLGELQVLKDGRKLGWMHEHGGRWYAFTPVDGVTGQSLGVFTKIEAVQTILAAAPPG
jgi:hypothetical protein